MWLKWQMRHAPARYVMSRQHAASLHSLEQRQEDMFFILGTGRSGTQLLTSLLSHSDAMLLHEPDFKDDVATMEAVRASRAKGEIYWKWFRSRQIDKRWQRNGAKKYGEVTGTIRYHAPLLAELFPKSKLFLLSRDGRGFVRSLMGWKHFYGPKSKGAFALKPFPEDPMFSEWPRMTRFERVCWAWTETNEFLMRSIPKQDRVTLECIVRDRSYFEERIVKELGLEVPEGSWEAVTQAMSRNSSKTYDFPAWQDWTHVQRDAFKRICGDTMERLGYHF